MDANLFHLTNFGVHFDAKRMPTRAQWEAAMRECNVDFAFAEGFEPADHREEQTITVVCEGVSCEFVLGLGVGDSSMSGPNAIFRYDGGSFADLQAAMFAAGALAVVTDGSIHWQRAKGGSAQGKHAFKLIRNDIKRDRDRRTKNPDFFKRRLGDAVEVATYSDDWLKCPRCNWRFTQRDPRAWDGEKHRKCGQKIIPRTG